jgi:hypothetical protein
MTDNLSPSIFPEDYPGNEWYESWIAYLRSKRPDPDYPEDSDDGL